MNIGKRMPNQMTYPKLFIACWTAVWCFCLNMLGNLFSPAGPKLGLVFLLVNFKMHVRNFVLYFLPLYGFGIWIIGVLIILGVNAYISKRRSVLPQ